MKAVGAARRAGMSTAAKRCLTTILEAELNEQALEAHTWRAKNAKRIRYVDELTRARMVEYRDNTHYVVRLYGLLSASARAAGPTLLDCQRLFKVLRNHYRSNPKAQIQIEEVAKRLKLTPKKVTLAANFLSRSPAYLGVHVQQPAPALQPTENYVTLSGFDDLKIRAIEEAELAQKAMSALPNAPLFADARLKWDLQDCESEPIRDCFRKALERLSRDTEGAITLARSMLEAACKHVLEEFGTKEGGNKDLPKLFKEAARCLKLDPNSDLDETLRRMLHGGIAVVDGLASLRNRVGDAHGRSPSAPKPARRHAELAVMLSTAMTSFLLETLDAQRSLR
jgi:Abortive infection C-terminus